MSKIIQIDPITRLEGHGKINIFLNDKGEVEHAFLQVPELRGFEKFAVGRPAEEMPRITPRICGVCPTAHHMASVKALDDLFDVEPTPVARLVRRLYYNLFMFEDHLLHLFYLGGPDFLVGAKAKPELRNILGVISKVGVETAKKLILLRKAIREIMTEIGGKVIHPVFGLPGGISKPVHPDTQKRLIGLKDEIINFAKFVRQVFHDTILDDKENLKLILDDAYYLKTNYMGMVTKTNEMEFVDGEIRVVDTGGREIRRFNGKEYLNVIAEHVEPWSYIKFTYLKEKGWKGFQDGQDTSLYRVAPLGRINVADRCATPIAEEERQLFYKTLKEKPVHHTLAYHWARVIEIIQAAETIAQLSETKELTDPDVRNIPSGCKEEGVGIVEAPRGTLIHHYKTDENGIITKCNLIVATLSNSASMNINIERVAKKFIKKGKADQGILNLVEIAFRAYDPCHACATHSLPGEMPLVVTIFDHRGNEVDRISRGIKQ